MRCKPSVCMPWVTNQMLESVRPRELAQLLRHEPRLILVLERDRSDPQWPSPRYAPLERVENAALSAGMGWAVDCECLPPSNPRRRTVALIPERLDLRTGIYWGAANQCPACGKIYWSLHWPLGHNASEPSERSLARAFDAWTRERQPRA